MTTLSEAQKVIDAATAQAEALGVTVAIAVVDERGDLVATVRMDGGRYFLADIARGKAMVSGTLGAPSGTFQDRGDSPFFQFLQSLNGGRLVPLQGAVPLAGGGAVAAAGATSEQDEAIAAVGAAAVSS